MQRIAGLGVVVGIALAAAACDAGPGGPTSPRAVSPTPHQSTSGSASTSGPPSPTGSTAPIPLPAGTRSTISSDVPATDLDAARLIPRRADVEEAWVLQDPEAVVVAYVVPGDDPFRPERGTLVWRRFDGSPAWRAVAWFPASSETGVLGVEGLAAEVTGDGLQDVLMGAFTGGSGACARWTVIDVAAADVVFTRDVCDGRIDPSVGPIGLSIDQAVYRVGDPHCCPSAFKTTVLTYDGDGTWSVTSKEVRETA